MIKRDELLRTEEYWFEVLQNEIYRMVDEYMKNEGINQSQLATKLGVTKGYISQIINGNFNYTLKKMIELTIALNKAPAFEFKNLEQYINDDRQARYEIEYKKFYNLSAESKIVNIFSGKTTNSKDLKMTNGTYDLDAA